MFKKIKNGIKATGRFAGKLIVRAGTYVWENKDEWIDTALDKKDELLDEIEKYEERFDKRSDAQLIEQAKKGGLKAVEAQALKNVLEDRGLI